MRHTGNAGKIVNKGKFHQKHGKHKSVLMEVRALQKKKKPKSKMYPSVHDALNAKD